MDFLEQGQSCSCSGTSLQLKRKAEFNFHCPNVPSASAGIGHGIQYIGTEGEECYRNTFITFKLHIQTI